MDYTSRKITLIEQNEIRLNSGMDEAAFGKTKFDTIVTQYGLIASMDSNTDENIHFSFDKWNFSEVKAYPATDSTNNTPQVFYCGSNPFSKKAAVLSDFFRKNDNSEERFYACLFVCAVMTQAAKENIEIPQNGAEGIIVDLESKKLLFLPQDLFGFAANGCSNKESAFFHRNWINQTLDGLPFLCFERAVIAYTMLTGTFPYSAEDPIEHNSDILDRKFIPIELLVPELSSELAQEINRALKLNSNAVLIPGKKKSGKTSEDLTPTPDFPLQLLRDSKEIAEKAFNATDKNSGNSKEVEAYIKHQDAQINRKRFLRRNKSKFLVSAIGAVILTIICINTVKTHGEEYTSKGLTSEQTITAFFQGVNAKDIPLLENITQNRAPKQFVSSVSQIYVISKQRQHYNQDNGFVNPARYFLLVNNSAADRKTGIYGTTGLLIDGKIPEKEIPLKQKNQHPVEITDENGLAITKGSTVKHNVDFYLFHSEGTDNDDNGIIIEKFLSEFTLTFKNGRWIISDITAEQIPENLDSFKFKQELFKSIQENDGDCIKAAAELKAKYKWIPEPAEIEAERELIRQEFEDTVSYLLK